MLGLVGPASVYCGLDAMLDRQLLPQCGSTYSCLSKSVHEIHWYGVSVCVCVCVWGGGGVMCVSECVWGCVCVGVCVSMGGCGCMCVGVWVCVCLYVCVCVGGVGVCVSWGGGMGGWECG